MSFFFCFILSNYVAYYYLNALSGWGSISTEVNNLFRRILCSVSMPSRAGTPFLHIYGNCYFSNSIILYQCPFGLKLHFYGMEHCSYWRIFIVSMPFRAKAPFLRYPFENLGFMRFLEPVFAGIYQNILTMTIFRAC